MDDYTSPPAMPRPARDAAAPPPMARPMNGSAATPGEATPVPSQNGWSPSSPQTPRPPVTPLPGSAAAPNPDAKPSVMDPKVYLDALIDADVLDQRDIVNVLGTKRNKFTLAELEFAVVGASIISPEDLAVTKGKTFDRMHFDVSRHDVTDGLDRTVANKAGALQIDRPGVATYAFIEDTEENVGIIEAETGSKNFARWTITAPMFQTLWQSVYVERSGGATTLRADSAPLGDMYTVLDEAVYNRASDLHLHIGRPPMMRVDNELVAARTEAVTDKWMRDNLPLILPGHKVDRLLDGASDIDGAFSFGPDYRWRLNVGRNDAGVTLAARVLPSNIPTPEDLGIPKAVRDLAHLERGLVLISGPTGSGKSTTLASLLASLRDTGRHLITLEDPVEYKLPAGKYLVSQREQHETFETFAGGLRQALRQDPDVILVGELRDRETMQTALLAAETGHLVFATTHSKNAQSTIERLIGEFPADEQDHIRASLATTLRGIISQSLMRRSDTAGRVAAFEVLIANAAIANLLSQGAVNQLRQQMESGRDLGMITMEQALAKLVKRGWVSMEDGLRRAMDKDSFNDYVRN